MKRYRVSLLVAVPLLLGWLAHAGETIQEPPHWMMLWPFDPKSSGLPTTSKQTEPGLCVPGRLGPT
jgi:hypothetical protein